MSAGPRVSIVMPLHDKERHVSASIGSVLEQSVQDFELVVVDDGSTDRGPALVQGIGDPRVRLVVQQRGGVSAARNRGIAEASAELLAFLDADDLWDPDLLETLLDLRRSFPACEVVATNYRYLLPDGETRPTVLRGLPPPPWTGELEDYFGVAALSDPPLWTSAVGVTRRAMTGLGGFPATLAASEDLVTWARLAARHRIAYSVAPKASYRLREALYEARRDPDLDREAGQLLELLACDAKPPASASIRRYVSSWYRNRASRYLQSGRSTQAREELRNMRRFQDADLRFYLFSIVARLPARPAARVAKGFTLVNRLRRSSLRPAPKAATIVEERRG